MGFRLLPSHTVQPIWRTRAIRNDESGGRILARADFTKVSYADPFRVRASDSAFISNSFPSRLDHTSDLTQGSIRISPEHLPPGKEIVQRGGVR